MLTFIERKQIQQLLYHGSGKLIAERAGVTRISVSNWFNGKNNSEKIENVVFNLFTENRKHTEQKLKEVGLL